MSKKTDSPSSLFQVVSTESRGLELVVAGGGQDETTVEILSLNSLSWRLGPPLPEPLSHAGSVSLGEKSFLFLGGATDLWEEFSDKIYEYDAENQSWTERIEKLARPLRGMTSIMMDSKDISCGRT